MDRGRQIGSSDLRKRAGKTPTMPERSSAGPYGRRAERKYGEMIDPQFGGSRKSFDKRDEEDGLIIDPNLLVGPLYTGTSRRTSMIKEQLSDITEKLHRTLHTFDEFADFEPGEDPVITMKRRIMEVNDPTMQYQLTSVMDHYEDMAQQLKDAHTERDDMLLQLADWFTTDHLDLEDIKTAMDDSEENHLKQSYFDTMTNFEKLKKLQKKIGEAAKKGKPTQQLERKKVELEQDVMLKFRKMKDMSMQTMKLKVSDDAPWKHAANEVVNMLRNARAENAEEVAGIQKHMKSMLDQLEKQAFDIRSLTAELRDKKEVIRKLTDENGDLSQEVAVLGAKIRRYQKDLEAAKELIWSLRDAQAETGATPGAAPPPISAEEEESIAKVLAKLEDRGGPDVVRKIGSDPTMLKSRVQELEEDLSFLREDFEKQKEDVTEMTTTLQEKREYIGNMEAENEKLSKEVRKFKVQLRELGAPPPAPTEAKGDHQCEHCNCHILDKDNEEVDELKQEVQKWQEKCNHFKTMLADTEMKLSQAYKEISDLRMDREPAVGAPAPAPKEGTKEPREREKREPVTTAEAKPPEPKKPRRERPEKPKPERPKTEARPRYLQQSKEMKLAPIEKSVPPEETIPPKTAAEMRELSLYKAGDLQGKLNMLTNEIMEYVTEIGRMLHTEKEEPKKLQKMTAFSFDATSQSKKEKKLIDPREQESLQKKSQALMLGQISVAKLRDAYEMLSNSLGLQHSEYEAIYRSFKISHQRQMLRHEIMRGRLPATALQEFDRNVQSENKEMLGQHMLLAEYYNISYGGAGGGAGTAVANKPRSTLHRRTSSSSIRSESPETEAKLNETIHALRMQRSRSDLDVRPPEAQVVGGQIQGAAVLGGPRESIFLGQIPDSYRRESLGFSNKQEVKISKAVVPKKGLISLSTTEEDSGVNVLGEKQGLPAHESPHHGGRKKQHTLIQRKDILEQLKEGNRLLEEEEQHQKEEDEMTKTLGEYTILDLQEHILGLTDTRTMKQQRNLNLESPVPPNKIGPHPPQSEMKETKPVKLPKIRNFNPFS